MVVSPPPCLAVVLNKTWKPFYKSEVRSRKQLLHHMMKGLECFPCYTVFINKIIFYVFKLTDFLQDPIPLTEEPATSNALSSPLFLLTVVGLRQVSASCLATAWRWLAASGLLASDLFYNGFISRHPHCCKFDCLWFMLMKAASPKGERRQPLWGHVTLSLPPKGWSKLFPPFLWFRAASTGTLTLVQFLFLVQGSVSNSSHRHGCF